MFKKVITNLVLSKAPGLDFKKNIPVMVLKNCELGHSYIVVELFNMCLKNSCFLYCWKVSLLIPIFINVGKRSSVKTTALLDFFLWLVKFLKNL